MRADQKQDNWVNKIAQKQYTFLSPFLLYSDSLYTILIIQHGETQNGRQFVVYARIFDT